MRREAIAAHYAAVAEPKSAREVAEEGDDAEAQMLDEMAAVLRARGCGAREAVGYVAGIVAYLQAKDRAVVRVATEGAGEELWRPDALEALRVMGSKLIYAPKPRLSAGCMMMAAGFEDHPGLVSQRAWAARQQVSHEHVSNEVQEWQRVLKLPPTSGQKTAAQKAIYRDTNGKSGRGIL